jgi:hypothetical protein
MAQVSLRLWRLCVTVPRNTTDVAGCHAEVPVDGISPALGLRIRVSGEPAIVQGDTDRLRQLLANRAHNSATVGSTTVRVHVTADRAVATLELPAHPGQALGSRSCAPWSPPTAAPLRRETASRSAGR